jgi:cytidylate kinase
VKVFVIGASGVGKTPMATHLAARCGLAHVRASAWARAGFPGTAPAPTASLEERAAFVEAITAWSTAELARDPWVSIDHLAVTADLSAPCVVEGVRNPLDFIHLYDPRGDVVIWLTAAAGGADGVRARARR